MHGDFLQDHLTFALELAFVEGAAGDDFAQEAQRIGGIFLQHLGVIDRVFVAGVGVHIAAHEVEGFGDVARVHFCGAFEGHVLEHVAEAPLIHLLMPRADIDRNRKRGGVVALVALGSNAKAVGQGGEVVGHGMRFSALDWLSHGLSIRGKRTALLLGLSL